MALLSRDTRARGCTAARSGTAISVNAQPAIHPFVSGEVSRRRAGTQRKCGMASQHNESWSESRLERQDSVAADGWSKRSDFEESAPPQRPWSSRPQRSSFRTPLLLICVGLLAVAAYRWMVG